MSRSQAFWQGKCVIVTGASSGIGKALAVHLTQQGAKVGLLARRQTELQAHAAHLQAQGSTVAWVCADVVDPAGMTRAIAQLEQQLGACDVLIANAGIYRKTDVKHFDLNAQHAVVATNLQGVLNSIHAVLPGMMQRQQGHLVAIASLAGMIGLPAAGTYSASKAAVVTLFQSLRVDLHPYGIKATVAAPGFVDTPIITDEERASVKDLLTAEQAAIRICTAIERNRALDWFPWQTWLACRLLSLLPSGLYRRLVANIPEMEEPTTTTPPSPPSSEGKR